MSEWPSVSFENAFLEQLCLELRKRLEAIRPLVSHLSCKRVDDIEEFASGGGVPHQGLDLAFSLWGNPAPRVFIKIYDDHGFELRTLDPCVSVDGRLSDPSPPAVAGLIEQTLRAVPQGDESVRRLWEQTLLQ